MPTGLRGGRPRKGERRCAAEAAMAGDQIGGASVEWNGGREIVKLKLMKIYLSHVACSRSPSGAIAWEGIN